MKKLFALISFLTVLSHFAFSQHQADKWYFGIYAGLDFSSGTPVPITNGAMSTSEGCSSISDGNGDLLFYTNGIDVWNKNNQVMPNGSGLDGGISSTQSALIVPLPGSSSQYYYIFTTPETGGAEGFRYSVVDITLQGGLGDVVVKNELILLQVTEKLAAVNNSNGFDTWVVAHEWGTNSFYAYSLSTAGLDPNPVISNVGIVHNTSVIQNTYGQMKFSTCNERLAAAISFQDTVQIFHFDPATGEVSNPISIPFIDHVYGLEFSPDGNKLYITTYITSEALVQFDISSGIIDTILDSKFIVSTTPDIYGMQLGPDGKIYVARAWVPYLGVINDPDIAGAGCNYTDTGVDLDPNAQFITSSLSLPGFVQTMFWNKNSCLATGVNETSQNENTVYPNPSAHDFTLSLGSPSYSKEITIYDLSGRIIERYITIPGTVNFSFGENLEAGMYSVLVKDEEGVRMMKVVKM